jgi:hypothetical protein
MRHKETLNRNSRQEATDVVDAGRRYYANMLCFGRASCQRDDKEPGIMEGVALQTSIRDGPNTEECGPI